MPAVKLTWYQGENKPEIWTAGKASRSGTTACCSSATRGCCWPTTASTCCCRRRTSPTSSGRSRPFRASPSHHAEWIDACKTGTTPSANFEYSGWLTEANHLGNVAYRAGKKLEWDAAAMRATNAPEADAFIRREYRKGWEL